MGYAFNREMRHLSNHIVHLSQHSKGRRADDLDVIASQNKLRRLYYRMSVCAQSLSILEEWWWMEDGRVWFFMKDLLDLCCLPNEARHLLKVSENQILILAFRNGEVKRMKYSWTDGKLHPARLPTEILLDSNQIDRLKSLATTSLSSKQHYKEDFNNG